MTISKEIIIKAGIKPKIKFFNTEKNEKGNDIKVPNGRIYKAKFIADKEVKAKDFNGKEIDAVKYLFEINGEQKTHTTPKFNKKNEVSYFVVNMADYSYGDTLYLEGKRKGITVYINISPVKDLNFTPTETDEDEDVEDIDDLEDKE